MQANGDGLSGEFSDLRNYLIARMMWNPELDDGMVLSEFVRLHYKNAAQPILDCINMFHDNAEESKLHPRCFPSPDDVGCSFKRPVHNLRNGSCFKVHDGNACIGCEGYLHFVLNKLRRPDPADETRLLIDRQLEKNINVFIGPETDVPINPDETNIIMGTCQQHHADMADVHIPGCPPHMDIISEAIKRKEGHYW